MGCFGRNGGLVIEESLGQTEATKREQAMRCSVRAHEGAKPPLAVKLAADEVDCLRCEALHLLRLSLATVERVGQCLWRGVQGACLHLQE